MLQEMPYVIFPATFGRCRRLLHRSLVPVCSMYWRSQAGRRMTMLVMTRRKNEAILINHDITVVVVEIRGDKVRLGIDVPVEIPVHRKEVYDEITRSHVAQGHSENPAIKRKKAEILDRVAARLADMNDLDQLFEFEKKIG